MRTKVDLEIYLPNYFLFQTQFAKIITAENQIIQQYKFYNFHILDYKGKTKWHLVNDVKSTISSFDCVFVLVPVSACFGGIFWGI